MTEILQRSMVLQKRLYSLLMHCFGGDPGCRRAKHDVDDHAFHVSRTTRFLCCMPVTASPSASDQTPSVRRDWVRKLPSYNLTRIRVAVETRARLVAEIRESIQHPRLASLTPSRFSHTMFETSLRAIAHGRTTIIEHCPIPRIVAVAPHMSEPTLPRHAEPWGHLGREPPPNLRQCARQRQPCL